MLNTEKVLEVISKINALFIEDTRFPIYWSQLAEVLSEDEQETIKFLDSCNDENVVDNISSVFGDISSVLQSKDFIECIERLQIKFPNLSLKPMIEIAIEFLD